jgi:hypothetical protein
MPPEGEWRAAGARSYVECQGSPDHMTRSPLLLYIAYKEGRPPSLLEDNEQYTHYHLIYLLTGYEPGIPHSGSETYTTLPPEQTAKSLSPK